MTGPDWAVRRLAADDIERLAAFTRRNGWPHGEQAWHRLIDLEPAGCFGVTDASGHSIIGTVTSITYGTALAWIGMMVVDAAHRRQGMASALMAACMEHLQARGVARMMLDATSVGLPLYERFGFRALHRVARWQGPATEFFGPRAVRLRAADMGAVIAYDEQRFGAPRGRLLLHIQAEFPRLAWVDRDSRGRVQGYIMAQRSADCVSIGPWLHDSPWRAAVLLNTVLGAVRGDTVRVHLHDRNPSATPIVQDRSLSLVSHTTRMIWGEADPPDGEPASIFGVASLAWG
jgi:GNAT superfamily N-acetyltransferase